MRFTKFINNEKYLFTYIKSFIQPIYLLVLKSILTSEIQN